MAFPLAALLPFADKILDLIPDPEAKAKAKAELFKEERKHELELLSTQMTAIVTEAQSEDPWTSRARPTFLYVVYFLILSSVPMGFVFAFAPDTAQAVTEGFKAWLAAIPDTLYTLMGVGYLGYTGARSFDKRKNDH